MLMRSYSMIKIAKIKYLILRRITQVAIIVLYLGANIWGWNFLTGNLSSSKLMGTISLSDPFAVLQIASAGALLTIDLVSGALIVLIFYALIGGRAFCSWVCPVNIITDAANYLRRVLRLEQVQRKEAISRNIRYWGVGLAVIISAITGVTAFEFVSPVGMVHRGLVFGMGFGWAAIVVIFLFDLFVLKNGWCGHLCPLGGFYSAVGKYSIFRVEHNSDKCTACMKCKVVCPESQVLWMVAKESKVVRSGECTNCARCIEVCDDDALNFSITNFLRRDK